MTISYQPKGVCSRKIEVTIEDGMIKDVRFSGGCSGNTHLLIVTNNNSIQYNMLTAQQLSDDV